MEMVRLLNVNKILLILTQVIEIKIISINLYGTKMAFLNLKIIPNIE